MRIGTCSRCFRSITLEANSYVVSGLVCWQCVGTAQASIIRMTVQR